MIMGILIFSCHFVMMAFASSSMNDGTNHEYNDNNDHHHHNKEQFKRHATLIVNDMSSKSRTFDKDSGAGGGSLPSYLPKDCWIDTVEILQQSFFQKDASHHHHHRHDHRHWLSFPEEEEEEEDDDETTMGESSMTPRHSTNNLVFTPSANFCSSLNVVQKQAMAVGLTKCHFYSSGLAFQIPETCTFENVSSGRDPHAIQSCLTNLDKTAFLVYSQFFTHTEMMCIKVTEDVRMYRKEEVLDRYEKKFLWMDERLERFELLEHMALDRFEHGASVMDRFEATAKIMDAKIMDIQRIENVTKDLGDNIERTVSMTFITFRLGIWSSGNTMDEDDYGHTETEWIAWMAHFVHVGSILFDIHHHVSSHLNIS